MKLKRRKVLSGRLAAPKTTEKVKVLRTNIGVTRKVFARLVDVSERSLADFESEKRIPGNAVQRRVEEVDRLRTALAEIIDPTDVAQWLQTPNPAFDNLKPLEVIERGQIDRIWRMVHLIESGAAF